MRLMLFVTVVLPHRLKRLDYDASMLHELRLLHDACVMVLAKLV